MSSFLFTPEARQTINYRMEVCSFLQHPNAVRGVALCEDGRRSKVYPLEVNGQIKYAIKIFKPRYRTQENFKKDIEIRVLLRTKFPDPVPDSFGLTVSKRGVINEMEDKRLLEGQPNLEHCIVMPWIKGDSWSSYVYYGKSLSKNQSVILAQNICAVMFNLEERKLAHCDVSGENILFQWQPEVESYKVELIDIEEIYGSGLSRPEVLPAGSPGYSPKWLKNGIWSEDADRFASGVLLTEIIGWQSSKVRENKFDKMYFERNEVGTECSRYKILHDEVRKINPNLALLFARMWYSSSLSECPTIKEWKDVLSRLDGPPPPFIPEEEAKKLLDTKTYLKIASAGKMVRQVSQKRVQIWNDTLKSEKPQYTDEQAGSINQVWLKNFDISAVSDWIECSCGNKIQNSEIYCQKCGKQLLTDRICPHCKGKTPVNSIRCRMCGKEIGGLI